NISFGGGSTFEAFGKHIGGNVNFAAALGDVSLDQNGTLIDAYSTGVLGVGGNIGILAGGQARLQNADASGALGSGGTISVIADSVQVTGAGQLSVKGTGG